MTTNSKRLGAIAVLTLAISAMTGCYTVEANLPGTLRNDVKPDQTETVGKVKIEKGNWFFLWGLMGNPPPDFFSTELKQQVKAKGGDGVTGLTYESQQGCVDLIIGGLTGGCISPMSFTVSGNIVRVKAAPLPGKSLAQSDGGDATAKVAQAY
ncbi:MAG: hypothetical protein HYS27_20835 [Deltaproteobacteria bacterium]|nr:hypothetical protein [Deltaproteobacteria bacterium]